MLEDLTGPTGMPRAMRSSSDRSPGFFSFRRVSNSFPCRHTNTHTAGQSFIPSEGECLKIIKRFIPTGHKGDFTERNG